MRQPLSVLTSADPGPFPTLGLTAAWSLAGKHGSPSMSMLTGSSMKKAMMVMTWNRFMLSRAPCRGKGGVRQTARKSTRFIDLLRDFCSYIYLVD
jgi:hypothetical protein